MRLVPPALACLIINTIACLPLVAQEPADGTMLGVIPYAFPPYENARGYTRPDGSQDSIEKYWTRDEYETAVSDSNFEFQKLQYASDGLRVVAYTYKPRTAASPLPTIVFNRGSGWHHDLAPVLLPYFHRLAQAGYAVIAPMYRQSDGAEGIDANGGDDLNDLLNILPVIEELPYADANNVFMTGESRGAMMVYQAIREKFPMRAAAVWGGFTDLRPLLEAQPALVQYAQQHWPGFDADNMEANIERRSAIYWPEAFDVPVLFMHGESDASIPVQHTYDLVRKLQELGRLYGLIVFAGDNHILARSQVERDRQSVAWFKRFHSSADAAMFEFLRTNATERDINDRGYDLLRRGRTEEAIGVFQLGVERFPESPNAHDSLGEAQAMAGMVAAAIESYSRALQLAAGDAEQARIRRIIAALRAEDPG